jgi:hypothetical protein
MTPEISNPEVEARLHSAQNLYLELLSLGFNYGCLEVSLIALGANLALSDVDRTEKDANKRSQLLEKNNLVVNWLISTDKVVTSKEISAIIEGEIQFAEDHPNGEVMGYLLTISVPDQVSHAIAVVCLAPNSYIVVDTKMIGRMPVTAENLAYMLNQVLNEGGKFEIAQIKNNTASDQGAVLKNNV